MANLEIAMVALDQKAIASKIAESVGVLATCYLVAEEFNKKW